MRPLIPLARKYCCDKLFTHSYIPFYEELFDGMEVKRLLEIGIGYEELMTPFVPKYIHGASLKMWEEYFPEAEIFGCDIRKDTLFNEGRIRTYVCDQSNPRSLENLITWIGEDFDVIIDDGSHVTEHQIIAARTLIPHLNHEGGVYIIEDVKDPKEVAHGIGSWLWMGSHLTYPDIISFSPRGPVWDDTLVVIQKI